MDFVILESRRFTQPEGRDYQTVERLVKDFEIDFELSNGREYSIGGKTYFIKKGDMCVRFPGQLLTAKGRQDSFIVTLSFDGIKRSPLYTRNTVGPIQKPINHPLIKNLDNVISFDNYERITSIYTQLFALSDYSSQKAFLLVEELLLLANAQVKRNALNRLNEKPSAVDLALSYIKERLGSPLSLDALAKITFLDKSYLIKLFKKRLGKTPYQVLIETRLDKARDIILSTDISVSKTAEYCGYNTTSFFIAEYKKRFGLTPKQDRINNKK